MSYSTQLFAIGILISFLIPIIEEIGLSGLEEIPSSILASLFSYAPHFWKLGYSVLLVFVLPAVIIPKFRNLFVEKHFKWYSFLSGNTFGFTIIEIITFSLPAQTFPS